MATMTRIVHALRTCRSLRHLCYATTPGLQQATGLTAAVGCQASTSGSGCEPDGCSLLSTLNRRLTYRFFSSQTAASSARAREVLDALREPVGSLYFDRGEIQIPPDLDNPLGRAMLRLMAFESKRSKLLHGAQRLYEAVTEQVDSGVLQRAFQTGKVFWSTYVLLSLHVWMIIYRLRTCSHPDVRFFRQRFYNQFQQDVEYRVYAAGVQVGVSKWLKKLEEHFYETGYELDQILMRNSSDTLTDVILRKFYGGEERHRANADLMARYVTRELQCLTTTDDEAVVRGHVRFSLQALATAMERAGVVLPAEGDEGAAGTGVEARAAVGEEWQAPVESSPEAGGSSEEQLRKDKGGS